MSFLYLVIVALLSTPSHSDFKSAVFKKNKQVHNVLLERWGGVKEGAFNQKINHLDSQDLRTFKQRYYYSSKFANSSSSPTILFICGEVECTAGDIASGFASVLAKSLKANIVALEHRYYGESQPFELLTAENLQYLKVTQALEDLNAFQKFAQRNLGYNGPWISMGGSYAGSLSAWYRLKYPQNVVGAFASSAPVKSKADFEEYDKHMSEVVNQQCAQNIRKVIKKVEEGLLDTQSSANLKKQFQSESIKEDLDFLYVVSDMAAWFIQYGRAQRLCGALERAPDLVAAYARVAVNFFEEIGITPEMAAMQSAESLVPGSNSAFGLRQWMYQSCSEFGFFQVAYRDPKISLRSSKINMDYHNSVCDRLFGLKSQVNTEITNQNYYLPLFDESSSRIFFTNGSEDPWSVLSITEKNGNNTNPNHVAILMEGAAHCSDLSSYSTDTVEATQLQFMSLSREWLK